jgi:hypothetical protein
MILEINHVFLYQSFRPMVALFENALFADPRDG